jgi:hypothetical protein
MVNFGAHVAAVEPCRPDSTTSLNHDTLIISKNVVKQLSSLILHWQLEDGHVQFELRVGHWHMYTNNCQWGDDESSSSGVGGAA